MLARMTGLCLNRHMNAKQMISRLYRHYGSEAATAKALGINQSTVNRLRRGLARPTYDTFLAMQRNIDQIGKSTV